MKKEEVVSINLIRVVCAYIVVYMHVYINSNNTLGSFISREVLTRFAVPFFFMVSGYFFSIHLIKNDEKKQFKYLKRIIRTYFEWSIIYIAYDLFTGSRNLTSLIEIVKIIFSFFVSGTFLHFWYFPALIYSILISIVFNKRFGMKKLIIISIILYLIGLLGCSYYGIGNKIPFVKDIVNFSRFTNIRRIILMGLPFFVLGYSIFILKEKILELSNLNMKILLIFFFLLNICECLIVNKLGIARDVILTITLYPLTALVLIVCLENKMSSLKKYNNKFKIIASFTYYVHPLIIVLFNFILNNKTISHNLLLVLFLTCLTSTILAILLENIDNKFIKSFVN